MLGLATSIVLGVLGTLMLVPVRSAAGPVPVAAGADPTTTVDLPDDRLARSRPRLAALLDGTRIVVPRLQIDLPLLVGDSDRDVATQSTPTGAAFLLPGSALPGTTGNSYVYAHARPGMFLSLWNVGLGDQIEIVAPSGAILSYTVSEIDPRVAVSDLMYLLPTDDDRLTLQTSTGPRVSDPRFVVVARRSGP